MFFWAWGVLSAVFVLSYTEIWFFSWCFLFVVGSYLLGSYLPDSTIYCISPHLDVDHFSGLRGVRVGVVVRDWNIVLPYFLFEETFKTGQLFRWTAKTYLRTHGAFVPSHHISELRWRTFFERRWCRDWAANSLDWWLRNTAADRCPYISELDKAEFSHFCDTGIGGIRLEEDLALGHFLTPKQLCHADWIHTKTNGPLYQ